MLIIKEFDEIPLNAVTNLELDDLKQFALENQIDGQGNYRPVLTMKNNRLYAQNFVGIIETKNKTTIEILPKIDFTDSENDENTKKIFLKMLRTWRGTRMAQLNQTNIKDMQHFNMLDIFIRLFLDELVLLTKRGLARNYHAVEDNIPVLKGRILFTQNIRTNIVDRSRFYVEYDEFSANRPANRLIHLTIDELILKTKHTENLKLLDQLKINFIEVPKSINLHDDWTKHKVDRSMRHYNTVMQWIKLFLFGHGLTTFKGKHLNHSLLFPMEEVFEDYVTYAFKRYRKIYSVETQGPRKNLAKINCDKVFWMKPDISLLSSSNPNIVLDTKWKRINQKNDKNNKKHGISQSDMYQLFAYGKKYKCSSVGLIYPKTKDFYSTFHYVFDKELKLFCFPFDVVDPDNSVKTIIEHLQKTDYY